MTSLCRDCLALTRGMAVRCPACASPRMVAHAELTQLAIAHMDCDAFYASVEKRDRPELRDRPVIVGGQTRGVVTAACYIARISGVRSAMPMFKATRLCPEAVIIAPDFRKYRHVSRAILGKARALTPQVQSLALDEAWLDLRGTERLHGAPPAVTLARLQAEVERDCGVTVSIGLAASRRLAKIASDLDKPRGFAVIGRADGARVLAPLPASVLSGVGPVFAQALAVEGFATVGDIAAADAARLARLFGSRGPWLARLARGEDDSAVDPDQARKSISAETTFAENLATAAELEARLWPLCEKVARHARDEGLAGRVVTLKLRRTDFRILTRRRSLDAPTQTARNLFAKARELLKNETKGAHYRLIGVGLSDLTSAAAGAGELFGDPESRTRAGERAVDALRERFGDGAVVSARALRASAGPGRGEGT